MRAIAFICFATLGLLFSSVHVRAVEAEEADCTMCHSDKAEGKSVHEAVRRGCKVCHIGVDASNIPHEFRGAAKGLPSSGAALCFSCHEKRRFSSRQGSVHAPVDMGLCTECHDVHASGSSDLLKSENVCYTCHAQADFTGKGLVHFPVASGMCLDCHSPHVSRGARLLRSQGSELCFRCHDAKAFTGPSVHVPVGLGMCVECHEPHQSNNAGLLKTRGRELCLRCHDEEAVARNPVHEPVAQAVCLDCHAPHSGGASLLR